VINLTKIAVATQNGGLDDQVSSIFGRCPTFTMVEAEDEEIKDSEVIQNEHADDADERSGAGIQAASLVANEGVDAVIAGNFGPNVASVLNQSGVEMVAVSNLSVREAVNKYLSGEVNPITQATAPAMSGAGGGRGQGMGRRMLSQQGTGRAPRVGTQPSDQTGTQKLEEDRIENLEKRVENIESMVKEIRKSIEDLK
jgi:predicted Fe-Mo cluster-binding NifX family protein